MGTMTADEEPEGTIFGKDPESSRWMTGDRGDEGYNMKPVLFELTDGSITDSLSELGADIISTVGQGRPFTGGVVRDCTSAIIDADATEGRGVMERSSPTGRVFPDSLPVRDRVVVTRYLAVGGVRPTVHVYGLFTIGAARVVRERMWTDAGRDGYRGRLEVSICRILDETSVPVRVDAAL